MIQLIIESTEDKVLSSLQTGIPGLLLYLFILWLSYSSAISTPTAFPSTYRLQFRWWKANSLKVKELFLTFMITSSYTSFKLISRLCGIKVAYKDDPQGMIKIPNRTWTSWKENYPLMSESKYLCSFFFFEMPFDRLNGHES